MRLWSERVFPWLMDQMAADDPEIKALRTRALAPTGGRVLELGFGTGLNLYHYPPAIRRIVAVDPNPGMKARARERMATLGIDVEHHRITAETLPFDAASFDSVVCTLTLCSIPRVEQALGEVRRVLKPGGQFLFLEHGRHPDPGVSRWQDRLNGVWGKLFDGCNINRDMPRLIADSGLVTTALATEVLPKMPRPVGYFFVGRARKA
jgi:ubiquinone/menaquinone biosynthesis C-methylase UbiE